MKAYRAIVNAASHPGDTRTLSEKLLLEGVLCHVSTPFELESDARTFADQVKRANESAGRGVGTIRVKEVDVNESSVIRHSEIA